MKRVALTCALASAVAVVAFSAAPASAATGSPTLDLSGPKSPGLLDKVTATGTLPGGVPGDQVTVTVQASGRTVDKKQVGVGGDGGFSFPFVVDACPVEVHVSSLSLYITCRFYRRSHCLFSFLKVGKQLTAVPFLLQ